MKAYVVTQKFYDDGKIVAFIENDNKMHKPTFRDTKTCDIYNTWFRRYSEALKMNKEAEIA